MVSLYGKKYRMLNTIRFISQVAAMRPVGQGNAMAVDNTARPPVDENFAVLVNFRDRESVFADQES